MARRNGLPTLAKYKWYRIEVDGHVVGFKLTEISTGESKWASIDEVEARFGSKPISGVEYRLAQPPVGIEYRLKARTMLNGVRTCHVT